MHLLFLLAVPYALNFDLPLVLVTLFAGILIDLDHLAIAPLKKWRVHLNFDIPKKLPLHNYFIFLISFTLSFLFILNKAVGAFFMGIFMHLLWDLLEKKLIFKMSLKHWKI
jgi:hypothetical protein